MIRAPDIIYKVTQFEVVILNLLMVNHALVAKIVGGQQAEVEPTSGAGMKSA